MNKKIIAAALAVLLAAGMSACGGKPENKGTQTDASVSVATATDAVTTKAETTTEAVTTTAPSTTAKEVTTTAKQILTTVKKVTTTKKKPTTTKKPVTTKKPTTTAVPETTEKKLYDYRTEENSYTVQLRYGVIQHKIVTTYYEKLPDGTEAVAKEEINVQYFDRIFYSAEYDDLLPEAKENRELYRSKINEVLQIINGYRAEEGLEPLTLNEKLTEIASVRAEEIAWSGDHDHTRPNFKSCFSLMRENGFEKGLAGENIGWGFSSAVSVCEAWKNSQTHYENIMNPEFTETGIGIAADPDEDGNLCWAQYFYAG